MMGRRGWFCAFISALALALYWGPYEGVAKDLGVHGHTFPIEEPDLLEQIMNKLKGLESSGTLKGMQKEMSDRVHNTMRNPKSLNLPRCLVSKTYEYDPSITVPYDLKDHRGVVFQKAGTRVNPLDRVNLSKTLVFFDGSDEAQVNWVKTHWLKPLKKENRSFKEDQNAVSRKDQSTSSYGESPSNTPKYILNPDNSGSQQAKLILTGGKVFDLMEEWEIPLFYDQEGKLTKKLAIKAVPAIVKQKGNVLEIQEINVFEAQLASMPVRWGRE